MSSFRIDDLWTFWPLAAAVPVVLVVLAIASSMSKLRRWSSVFARVALIALICAALAGVSSVRRTDQAGLIVLADVSGSVRSFVPPMLMEVPGDAQAAKQSWIASEGIGRLIMERSADRNANDVIGVVAFDGRPTGVVSPRTADGTRPWQRPVQIDRTAGSDLAGAIRLGLAMMPASASGRMILISDGNATEGDMLGGDVLGAARQAARAGVAIDVVPLKYEISREIIAEGLDAPVRAAAGSVAKLSATIRSTHSTRASVRLFLEDQPVDLNGAASGVDLEVELASGVNIVPLEARLDNGRIHRWRVEVVPEAGQAVSDAVQENNQALALTTSPGTGSVLIVDGVAQGAANSAGRVLANVLEQRQMDVKFVSAEGLPSNLLELQSHDLVILQNVGAEQVPEGTQAAITQYVSELGGGLIMIGGPNSFGAGGWKGSALEPILPVSLDLPDQMIKPAAAVVIVMDASGSMGFSLMGSTKDKQTIANEGAAAAVRSLDRNDLVGVVRFSSSAEWAVPLARNAEPLKTAEAILNLRPDGGTNIPPAMELAIEALRGSQAQTKHMIVLTDGKSEGRAQLVPLASKAASLGIKVSTIGVGDDADGAGLERMAVAGGGEYFPVADPNILPRIFLRAVRVIRTPMIREEPFVPAVIQTGSPLVAGLESRGLPALLGLTLTQAKIDDQKTLVPGVTYAMLTPKGEPVLAHWQVGLGQVAAFTSDASAWAKQWQDDGIFGSFWSQVVRAVARPSSAQSLELIARVDPRDSQQVVVRLEATDQAGNPMDGLTVPAALYSPIDGRKTSLRLSQISPGVYEGVGTIEAAGTYVITASPTTPKTGDGPDQQPRVLAPVVGGVVKPEGTEFRSLVSNEGLLEEVAKISSGRVLNSAQLATMGWQELSLRDAILPKETRQPWWIWFVIAAAAMFLLDVATRRIAWDRREPELGGMASASQVTAATERLKRAAPTRAEAMAPVRAPVIDRPVRNTSMNRANRAATVAVKNASDADAANPRKLPDRGENEQAQGSAETVTDAKSGGLLAAKRRARSKMEEQ